MDFCGLTDELALAHSRSVFTHRRIARVTADREGELE
jgi:hypothetical protein